MAITTRQITVSIYEFDGDPMVGAEIRIELKGLGNGVAGAVAPGLIEGVTDANGECVFTLWQNEGAYSNTYYQITSINPATGALVHRREVFYVFDSDANVKDLISLVPQPVNINQSFLNRVSADRAAAANSAAEAANYLAQIQALIDANGGIPGNTGSAPVVANQSITTVVDITRIIHLGPSSSGGVAITYESNSPNLVVNGNMASYTRSAAGSESVTVTATRDGVTGSGTISVTTILSSAYTAYDLAGVQVA